MLQVQQYLRHGGTLEGLNREYGIKSTQHPSLPLVILNYNQIESPKGHPIVRECRSLTLNYRNWDIVAKSMNRFFNWGEMADEMPMFDFSDFMVQTKEDGCLVVIYYFGGEWHANTRKTFGYAKMPGFDITWHQNICNALGVNSLSELSNNGFIKDFTYVCELCSPYNKIVRYYASPRLYLLTAFCRDMELTWEQVDDLKKHTNFKRPERFEFKDIKSVQRHLEEIANNDPTYEGVVICDRSFRRWKIKNSKYLALHRMRGESDNLFHPKYLLSFIMSGEQDELLLYFNEVKESLDEVQAKVSEAYLQLSQIWLEHKDIEDQKVFAQNIIGKTPFTSILFNVRAKYGKQQTVEHLQQVWKNSEGLIFKKIFKNCP